MYDLLNGRARLVIREDARAQMCVVGLKEFEVADVGLVEQLIAHGTAARCVGSTGANAESSRSHAIMQFVLKKSAADGSGSGLHAMQSMLSAEIVAFPVSAFAQRKLPRGRTGGETIHGKFSFIDLAGSERGADTSENDRQTRLWRRDVRSFARFERMHPRAGPRERPRPVPRLEAHGGVAGLVHGEFEFSGFGDANRLAGERLVRAHVSTRCAPRLPRQELRGPSRMPRFRRNRAWKTRVFANMG